MVKHLLNITMWVKSMTSKIPDYVTKEHEKRLNMSIEINQNLSLHLNQLFYNHQANGLLLFGILIF